jgi:hypothetical protein
VTIQKLGMSNIEMVINRTQFLSGFKMAGAMAAILFQPLENRLGHLPAKLDHFVYKRKFFFVY